MSLNLPSPGQSSAPPPRTKRPRRRHLAPLPGYAKLPAPPQPTTGAKEGLGALGTLLVHLAIAALIFTAATLPKEKKQQISVEVEMVETPKPKPPEPPKVEEEKKPEPVKPPPRPPRLARNLPPAPKDAPPPPPELKELPPPPPNEKPPPDAKPNAPVMIGVSLSSTTSSGGFSAPVGNTLYGNTPRTAPHPQDVQAYAPPPGQRYVPPYKVSTLPELAQEVKASYPEEARKQGLEGQVVLRLTIEATGKVAVAKVVKGAGNGFDEAALEAVRRFRFRPGTEGGEPIATEITYTYTFLLD